MTLIWKPFDGGRMGRCTGSPDTLVFDQRIDLRGFSAGSFAGLSTLHLLWKMPNVVTNSKLGAIACPPQLILTPPTAHGEHNYYHWLSLNHAAGWWDLARFLFVNPEAASSAKRDATPLRLLSWLSFRLEPAVDELIEATMLHLSTVEEVKDSDLLTFGHNASGNGNSF